MRWRCLYVISLIVVLLQGTIAQNSGSYGFSDTVLIGIDHNFIEFSAVEGYNSQPDHPAILLSYQFNFTITNPTDQSIVYTQSSDCGIYANFVTNDNSTDIYDEFNSLGIIPIETGVCSDVVVHREYPPGTTSHIAPLILNVQFPFNDSLNPSYTFKAGLYCLVNNATCEYLTLVVNTKTNNFQIFFENETEPAHAVNFYFTDMMINYTTTVTDTTTETVTETEAQPIAITPPPQNGFLNFPFQESLFLIPLFYLITKIYRSQKIRQNS